MEETKDLVDALLQLALTSKKILLVDAQGRKTEVSYKQLWNRSFYLQTVLKEKYHLKKGSKVMILCQDNEMFLYAFWGSILGGFLSVPIDATQRNKAQLEFRKSVQEKVEVELILTDFEQGSVNGVESVNLSDMCEKILSCKDYTQETVESSIEDILYIQYSSGSTGKPHGVVVTKENAGAAVQGLAKHFEVTVDDRFLTWAPLTHCFSLVMLHFLPLMQMAEQCVVATELFINNPLIWLDLIHEYRATRVNSLPFGLKHFVNVCKNSNRKSEWDLSCVKSLILGGEQVNYGLCKEFCDITTAYGLGMDKCCTIYGLSETAATATGKRYQDKLKRCCLRNQELTIGEALELQEVDSLEPVEQELLETGTVIETVELSIRDEERNVLPEGYLGHIYVSGPCVTMGYYKDEETNACMFVDGKWLSTGDIGFLKEGRLYVVGREKEIVVANGKKVACTMLEELIQPVLQGTGYQQCVVTNGINSNQDNEKVIAFVYGKRKPKYEEEWEILTTLKEAIRQEIFEKTGLMINEVVPVDDLPKTNSGKLCRRKLTEAYNNGIFEEDINKMTGVHRNKVVNKEVSTFARHDVEKTIISYIEEKFRVKVESLTCPINEYGIVSINIPAFIDTLNAMFPIHMTAGEVFRYFTIEKLVNYITYTISNVKEEQDMGEKEQVISEEKIAIIGMSCRFPGGANDIDTFWELLVNHKDGVCDAPGERWDVDKYYDPDKNAPGKAYTRKGGYLQHDINEFDARFFNMSPKEANALDPQQRLFLELTWEAFENANLNIEKYNGSNTGVYLGICNNEWYMSQLYSGELETINPYSLTGSCYSTACGRVSYTFGLNGPCAAVDTACSSSLTALHFACTGLLAGEADMQVVGGVNLIESPTCNIGFSKLQATCTDGYCKSFDAAANGYSRGEGGGVILLKRLSDAIADHNEILGVIRGTGINQDGKSNGLTAPNGEAQERLIRTTMVRAGVDPSDVDFVEMHGTGTKLGDPIEVGAVAATYGAGHKASELLKIGSVKSNIGHLEGAAGVASIIKVLLSMRYHLIPANLHFHNPNPLIDWDNSNIEVVAQNTPWEKADGKRIAAVNGFGFGGSNAHAIIEEYQPDPVEAVEEQAQDGYQYMLKISAQSESALTKLLDEYKELLENIEDSQLDSVIYHACRGRANLRVRLVVCGEDRQELIKRIKEYQKNGYAEGVISNQNDELPYKEARKTVFMFTGQGSQYVHMGKVLYDTNETFREAFAECSKLFRPYLLCSLTELLYGERADAEVIAKTAYAQPLIFTMEYALYNMWMEAGVEPEMVMGHSIGEYAAAVAAEVMSLQDAVKLVAARGKLMDMAPGHGKMATLFATEDQVKEWLKDYQDTVCIAAKNALTTCVISGVAEDVEKVEIIAEKSGCRVKELTVSHAFHSMLMEPVLEEFYAIASDIQYQAPKIRFVSSLYGKEVTSEEPLDARYWTDHVRGMVDFHKAITSIEGAEDYLFLEVGASRVLAALAKMCLGEKQAIAATLNRMQEDKQYLPREMAVVYASGVNLNWDNIYFAGKRSYQPIHLPNYPYDRKYYGMKIQFDRKQVSGWDDDYHPILGQRIDMPSDNEATIFQSRFTSREPYFMQEHIIFDTGISPAAAHTSMLLMATEQLSGAKSCVLSKMEFHAPLAVTEEEPRQVQLYVEQDGDKPIYRISSRNGKTKQGKWILHTKGEIVMLDSYQNEELHADIDAYKQLDYEDDIESTVYDFMRGTGFILGDGFRRIRRAHRVPGECISVIEPLKTVPYYNEYNLYPGMIDSVFQTGFLAILEQLLAATNDDTSKTVIPYFIEKITYNYRESDCLWCCTKSRLENGINYADMVVFNENGDVVLKVDNLMAKVTDQSSLLRELSNTSKLYYHNTWTESSIAEDTLSQRKDDLMGDADDTQLVIISDEKDKMEALVQNYRSIGFQPICVSTDKSYEKCSDDRYRIHFQRASDWKKLIEELAQNQKSQYRFFYLTSKDIEVDSEALVDYSAVKGLFYLVKEIAGATLTGKKSLTLMTQNVQKTDGESVRNLAGSMIWGFAKSFALEYADLYGGIVDLDEEAFSNQTMMDEVLTGIEGEACYRGQKRFAEKLVPHAAYQKQEQVKDKKIRIKEEASYLITGGIGALGMVYAKQLVKEGAKNLILVARHEPEGEAKKMIQAMIEQGVNVKTVCADVCNQKVFTIAVQEAAENLPPIKGVIHTAGVLRDGMLMDMDWNAFETVLRPKIDGAINLYQAVKDKPLDFFMMLSSITSVVGNMGQVNYAVANYFLNQFAGYLRLNRQPGFALCWGPWSEGGMAVNNDSITSNMERLGMTLLNREIGQKVMEEFFEQPYENLVIADVEWDRLASAQKRVPGRMEFLSELVSDQGKQGKNKNASSNGTCIIDDFQKLTKDEKVEFVKGQLKESYGKIMGFEKGQIATNETFASQGADSLMIFSMCAATNQMFKTELLVSLFFTYPTIDKMAEYLVREVLK